MTEKFFLSNLHSSKFGEMMFFFFSFLFSLGCWVGGNSVIPFELEQLLPQKKEEDSSSGKDLECLCFFPDQKNACRDWDCGELPIQKIAVIQFSFDGVNTHHCGVGSVVLQTQEILKDYNEQFHKTFKLFLCSADYSREIPEFSESVLERNRSVCKESEGEVFLMPIPDEKDFFGNPNQWEELCNYGADLCVSVINQNSKTVIFAHDTAYAQIPWKLRQRAVQIKRPYQAIWIPHGTSWKYNGHVAGIPKWPERHQWELTALQKAKEHSYKVAYISPTIKKDLLSPPFNAEEEVLTSFKTGILLSKYLKELTHDEMVEELLKRKIPLDKRLIFSIGRAAPLKGQDITLEMYRRLRQSYSDIHLVMLAPETCYMPEYIDLLRRRVAEEQLEVTLIDEFDSRLDVYLYQWPNTVMLSLLSRADTQPLTVMEGRANPARCILLTSGGDRSGDQVKHGLDGFTCSLDGLDQMIEKPIESLEMDQIVEVASKILDLSEEKRSAIVESGKQVILEKYNLAKNLFSNFAHLLNEEDGPLSFEKMKGGIGNPPMLVHSKNRSSIGLLKPIQKAAEPEMAMRLEILSQIREAGALFIPKIFKTSQGGFFTNLGGNLCYFIEYVPSDLLPITTEEMLTLTARFHQATSKFESPELLKKSKREEFFLRRGCFDDPWFQKYSDSLFSGEEWEKIAAMGRYFASDLFKELYESLPKQLIHGDNNQSNAIKNGEDLFLVDFDAFRYDIRLIDLASYFRYGGFEDLVALIKSGNLKRKIEDFYGREAGRLSDLEEKALFKIILFSNFEVLSWGMQMLQYSVTENQPFFTDQALEFIESYRQKILILLDLESVVVKASIDDRLLEEQKLK